MSKTSENNLDENEIKETENLEQLLANEKHLQEKVNKAVLKLEAVKKHFNYLQIQLELGKTRLLSLQQKKNGLLQKRQITVSNHEQRFEETEEKCKLLLMEKQSKCLYEKLENIIGEKNSINDKNLSDQLTKIISRNQNFQCEIDLLEQEIAENENKYKHLIKKI